MFGVCSTTGGGGSTLGCGVMGRGWSEGIGCAGAAAEGAAGAGSGSGEGASSSLASKVVTTLRGSSVPTRPAPRLNNASSNAISMASISAKAPTRRRAPGHRSSIRVRTSDRG